MPTNGVPGPLLPQPSTAQSRIFIASYDRAISTRHRLIEVQRRRRRRREGNRSPGQLTGRSSATILSGRRWTARGGRGWWRLDARHDDVRERPVVMTAPGMCVVADRSFVFARSPPPSIVVLMSNNNDKRSPRWQALYLLAHGCSGQSTGKAWRGATAPASIIFSGTSSGTFNWRELISAGVPLRTY